MAKTKTKGTAKTVSDTPVPQPITISSTNPKIMADNIKKLEKAIKGADDASEISYDNTESHLTASNVQAAIDEVVTEIGSITSPDASDVSYDNTSSGLTADDVQDAIDELNTSKKGLSVYGTFVKSSEVTGGTYPPDRPFIASIYGAGSNDPAVSIVVDNKDRLNKRVYLESTKYVYFNNSGAFSLSELDDGSTVVILSIN